MIKLIKQYKKLLIVLFFPYIYLLFVLVAPTHQAVVAPGGLTEVRAVIAIEDTEMLENFNTIYVYSYYPITPFQSWVMASDQTMDVYTMTARQTDTSMKDDYLQGQITKYVSFKTSIIKAYELASQTDASISITSHYEGLYVYYRPSRMTELEIGDQIVAVNGHYFNEYSHEDFLALASASNATFTVKRTIGDQIEFIDIHYIQQEGEPSMVFYPDYVIDSASPSFTFPGMDVLLGGPSGGLLQTLSIYASLVNINIGDLKIAGTGTIEMDGTVGRIGGITQKMYTAIYNNVDVFFIPTSHLSEIPSLNYPFTIVPVDTVEQAVNWLNEHFN